MRSSRWLGLTGKTRMCLEPELTEQDAVVPVLSHWTFSQADSDIPTAHDGRRPARSIYSLGERSMCSPATVVVAEGGHDAIYDFGSRRSEPHAAVTGRA